MELADLVVVNKADGDLAAAANRAAAGSATGSTPSSSSMRRTRSSVRCETMRWAAMRSAITPSANTWTAP
jgi:putative protein kinase ArgK-like GTPase of G3E family